MGSATFNLYTDEVQASDAGEDIDTCKYIYPKDYDAEDSNVSICASYSTFYTKLDKIYNEHKECQNESCRIYQINNANKIIQRQRDVCTVIMEHSNYDSPCVSKCLILNNDIKALKKKYNIEIDPIESSCNGLPEAIISFIYNILKYAKYIAPILAIILSILDWRNKEHRKAYDDLVNKENINVEVLSLISGEIKIK